MTHFPDRPLNRILYRDIPSDEECRRVFLGWKEGTRRLPGVRTQESDEYFRSRRRELKVSKESQIPQNQKQNQQLLGPSRHVPYKDRERSLRNSFLRSMSPRPLDLNRTAASRAESKNETGDYSASSSVYTSSSQPRSLHTSGSRPVSSLANRCPLCCTYPSEEGGLCRSCKREFAISDCSSMLCVERSRNVSLYSIEEEVEGEGEDYGDDANEEEWGSVVEPSSLEGDISSLIDGWMVSPLSEDENQNQRGSVISIPIGYMPELGDISISEESSQVELGWQEREDNEDYEDEGEGEGEEDLYDMDWFDYYSDESNFRDSKGFIDTKPPPEQSIHPEFLKPCVYKPGPVLIKSLL